MENWTHDFNIGSMVRTANAFAARRVHIVGPHKLYGKAASMADDVVYISQFGSVRSLTAGAAAAVAMHCWIAQRAM